jgi:hypothetical protein
VPWAAAVNVTLVFCAKLAEHVVGQLIPVGLLVIVPAFAGGDATDNWYVGVGGGVVVVVVLVPKPLQPIRLNMETANKNINQNLYPECMGARLLKRRLDEE